MTHQFREVRKGEKHHWWPEALSQYWTNTTGQIHCIRAGGGAFPANPGNIARITAGHDLRFGDDSGWTRSYEGIFDDADNSFRETVAWLQNVARSDRLERTGSADGGFRSQACSDAEWQRLILGIASLNVRSPRHRERCTAMAMKLRAKVDKEERKNLITINMLQGYPEVVDSLAAHGKIAIFFSESCELIFGDGFYSNLNSPYGDCSLTRMLVPLTPNAAVLYVSPMRYIREPRLVTCFAGCELVQMFNEMTQVYSKDCLFFRFQAPVVGENFLANEHLQVARADPMDRVIASIPGIDSGSSRDPWF